MLPVLSLFKLWHCFKMWEISSKQYDAFMFWFWPLKKQFLEFTGSCSALYFKFAFKVSVTWTCSPGSLLWTLALKPWQIKDNQHIEIFSSTNSVKKCYHKNFSGFCVAVEWTEGLFFHFFLDNSFNNARSMFYFLHFSESRAIVLFLSMGFNPMRK